MRRDLNLYRKSMERVIVVYTLMIYCALYQPVFKIYMEHRKSINCCDRVVPELGNSAIPLADLVLTDRGIARLREKTKSRCSRRDSRVLEFFTLFSF